MQDTLMHFFHSQPSHLGPVQKRILHHFRAQIDYNKSHEDHATSYTVAVGRGFAATCILNEDTQHNQ